jgi:anaerobic magnesium-protoporphyrin IX monomethyl ester cyclase
VPTYYRAQLYYLDPTTAVYRRKEQYGITGGGFEWRHATMDSHVACSIVEEMFCTIQNSVWMPQHGFEHWSVYYLRRHGFSHQQISDFVSAFNAAIKEKLLFKRRNLSPQAVDKLRCAALSRQH